MMRSNQQLNQLNRPTCWNSVYRKVLKMHKWEWESVKQLQWICERLDFNHVADKRKLHFEWIIKVTAYYLADIN